MPTTWELHDYDREFFAKELEDFVPEQIFDAHAHLYELAHWGPATQLENGPAVASLEEFRRQMEWITPGRKTSGLFFGVGLVEDRRIASNQFIAREVTKDASSRGELIVSPKQDPDQIRQELRNGNFVGLKVYHTFSPRKVTWTSEIKDFLTEDHVRIAHEEGLSITLHMVRDRAMADPVNQEQIRYYCEKYPNIKLILAHAARGFNPFHTIEGIHALRGLRKDLRFASLAIVALALGLGATTIIFSVINGILLEPFPFRDADRLVALMIHNAAQPGNDGRNFFSAPEFSDFREQNHVFEDVFGFGYVEVLYTKKEGTQVFNGGWVTGNISDFLKNTRIKNHKITIPIVACERPFRTDSHNIRTCTCTVAKCRPKRRLVDETSDKILFFSNSRQNLKIRQKLKKPAR